MNPEVLDQHQALQICAYVWLCVPSYFQFCPLREAKDNSISVAMSTTNTQLLVSRHDSPVSVGKVIQEK